ncbi:MAG: HAD family hydrolase [Simkaniaceae bacterium]|nr:HAD family hydrolase [Simkaniaceae bacterium]
MLIVFDLDDTLVDTSASITPFLQERALKKLVEAGLQLPCFDEGLAMLRSIDATASSGKNAVKEFLELQDGLHYLDLALHTIYEAPQFERPIQPVDYALDLLRQLVKDHTLGIVTAGYPSIQREKIALSGINPSYFSFIECCPEGYKKPTYQKMMKSLGIDPRDVAVCGDRISVDLAPAKELGWKTIHFRYGRGLGRTGLKSDVDYTILRLEEIPKLIRQIENNL